MSDKKLYQVIVTKIDYDLLKKQKSQLAEIQSKLSGNDYEVIEGILNLCDQITDKIEDNECIFDIVTQEENPGDEENNYEEIYNSSPKKVKNLIDKHGDNQDYRALDELAKKLLVLGYEMDYGLDGCITSLKKIVPAK